MKCWAVGALALCGVLGATGAAAQVTTQEEYSQRIKAYQTISPGGDTPFGERLNLMTGELSFAATDLVLEGEGPTIRVVRSSRSAMDGADVETMGSWSLAIPRIQTLVYTPAASGDPGAPGLRWRVSATGTDADFARCTDFRRPYFLPGETWNGYTFFDGEGGRQALLARTPEYPTHPSRVDPTGAAMAFPVVSLANWQFGCLPQTANGERGEGFLAVAPDGTTYRLDYLVGKRAGGTG